MDKIWIVYHDSSPDNNILGVFDNWDDAHAYLEIEGPHHENGALLSSFPVPWRRLDHGIVIEIG